MIWSASRFCRAPHLRQLCLSASSIAFRKLGGKPSRWLRQRLSTNILCPLDAHSHHSGSQGTYSRTSRLLLESSTSPRNTARTSSFRRSSRAVVFVPSHNISIQSRLLILALLFSLTASLICRNSLIVGAGKATATYCYLPLL